MIIRWSEEDSGIAKKEIINHFPPYSVKIFRPLGASSVGLVIEEDGQVVLHAEVIAPQDTVTVTIGRSANNQLLIEPSSYAVNYLPLEDRFFPSIPPQVQTSDTLDVLLLIDGTMTVISEDRTENPYFCFDDNEIMGGMVEQMNSLFDQLQNKLNPRFATLLFGDLDAASSRALDITSQYALLPSDVENIVFQPWTNEGLAGSMEKLPSSPGGDYVDGLSEALDACSRLCWNAENRKLIIVIGDSPGFSLRKPCPPFRGASANEKVRAVELESALSKLSELGVEIAALYVDGLDRSSKESKDGGKEALWNYSKGQYKNIASFEDYFSLYSLWKPIDFATQLLSRVQLAPRGYSYPVHIEAECLEEPGQGENGTE